jgi:hypothetical protein
MAGKLVQSNYYNTIGSSETTVMDITKLCSGMYLLQMVTNNSNKSVKFIKQ